MIETIIDTLLRAPAVLAQAPSIALSQLPQNSLLPGLVYNVVSDVDWGSISRPGGTRQAKVLVHGIAETPLQASAVAELARRHAVFTAPRQVAGARVSCCICTGTGQPDRDEATGAWLKPLQLELLYQLP